MDKEKRKEMMNEYKNRKVTGAVYCILCSGNERRWLKKTTDLQGAKSRFEFAVNIKSAPEPSMLKEFKEYGIEAFSLVVLEELEKKDTQTDSEFRNDIDALYEIWQEKFENGDIN